MKRVFKTTQGEVVVYPASGTGAWEAALVNTLPPGDRVLMVETGHFATLWQKMATKLGLEVEFLPGDWRHGADPDAIEKRLRADSAKTLKALCVVHNETSTGVTSRLAEVRKALDAAKHPALFMVDTISSLASIDYRHDEWGVDVTVAGSQKGLMLPPGLSFNCISPKAMSSSKAARLPRSYWAWEEMIANGKSGYFPYTPATNLLYGLREALKMLLDEEGLDAVFARHQRHAEATRRAVRAWGLEVFALDPREFSASLTGVLMPAGHDADRVRKVILDAFDLSLGTGLTKLGGKMFRIGHLGDFNDLMLMGTLAGVEMGLGLARVPVKKEGVQAAMDYLASCAQTPARKVA
jgi:alanine-glyoxylate transaminase/serine-glyoxylate transaminase/serine-pyruvate transaminase